MAPLKDAYVCKCGVPRLRRHLGQDSGLCDICNLVYDEPLYEMRLREHATGLPDGDLDAILSVVDPHYQALPR